MTHDFYAKSLARWQRAATSLAVVGTFLLLLLIPFSGGLSAFYQSYLFGYIFWVGLSLGCLALLMIQHLAGGPWGAMVRRFLEAGSANVVVMAVLFLPLLFGITSLYPWSDPAYLEAHPIVAAKTLYLNVPAFVTRSVIYFTTWIILALLFQRWSRRQDEGQDLAQHMRNAGALGIILYVATMTFAALTGGCR